MVQRNPADPDDRDQNVGQIRCEGEELVSILDDARGTQSMWRTEVRDFYKNFMI